MMMHFSNTPRESSTPQSPQAPQLSENVSSDQDQTAGSDDRSQGSSLSTGQDKSELFELVSRQIRDQLTKEESVAALRALELIVHYSPLTPISFFANGGEGFLFLVTKDDGQEYVLKCLKNPPHETFFCPRSSIGSYLREVQIPDLLRHPAIPQSEELLRLEPDNGGSPVIGILRKKIEGHSLKEVIDTREVSKPAAVLELLKKLLPVLAHIHNHVDNRTGHKIIHSDIKPANIILDIDGVPKLIDFSVARQFQPGQTYQHTVGIRGTLDYCPEEQLTGGGVPASDIYSLGVTVVHALLGFMPPELRGNWKKSEPFSIPSDIEISKEFSRILRKMIHPHLDMRYQSANEVLNDLQDPSLLVKESSSWYSWFFGNAREKTTHTIPFSEVPVLPLPEEHSIQSTSNQIESLFINIESAQSLDSSQGLYKSFSESIPLRVRNPKDLEVLVRDTPSLTIWTEALLDGRLPETRITELVEMVRSKDTLESLIAALSLCTTAQESYSKMFSECTKQQITLGIPISFKDFTSKYSFVNPGGELGVLGIPDTKMPLPQSESTPLRPRVESLGIEVIRFCRLINFIERLNSKAFGVDFVNDYLVAALKVPNFRVKNPHIQKADPADTRAILCGAITSLFESDQIQEHSISGEVFDLLGKHLTSASGRTPAKILSKRKRFE